MLFKAQFVNLLIHFYMLSLCIFATVGAAQAEVRIFAKTTPLGDLFLLQYNEDTALLDINQMNRDGVLLLSGTLSLDVFASTPRMVDFSPRQTGGLDLILEVGTQNAQEFVHLQIGEDGEIASVSQTRAAAWFFGSAILGRGNGTLVAGAAIPAGRTDKAAALVYFRADEPPQTVLRDTRSDDQFLAVNQNGEGHFLGLGVRMTGAQTSVLFLSEFDGKLGHIKDIPLDIVGPVNMDALIVGLHNAVGFLLVFELQNTAHQHFRLLHINTRGEVLYQQDFELPMAGQPRGILVLPDGRIIADFLILDQDDNTVFHGRYLAMLHTGSTAPIAPIRSLDAILLAPVNNHGQVLDLVVAGDDGLVLQPLYISQFTTRTRGSLQGLPRGGIDGITMFGVPERSFLLKESACVLALLPEPYDQEILHLNLGADTHALGFADNSIALIGKGLFMADGQPLPRIDLTLPDNLSAARLSARINVMVKRCH